MRRFKRSCDPENLQITVVKRKLDFSQLYTNNVTINGVDLPKPESPTTSGTKPCLSDSRPSGGALIPHRRPTAPPHMRPQSMAPRPCLPSTPPPSLSQLCIGGGPLLPPVPSSAFRPSASHSFPCKSNKGMPPHMRLALRQSHEESDIFLKKEGIVINSQQNKRGSLAGQGCSTTHCQLPSVRSASPASPPMTMPDAPDVKTVSVSLEHKCSRLQNEMHADMQQQCCIPQNAKSADIGIISHGFCVHSSNQMMQRVIDKYVQDAAQGGPTYDVQDAVQGGPPSDVQDAVHGGPASDVQDADHEVPTSDVHTAQVPRHDNSDECQSDEQEQEVLAVRNSNQHIEAVNVPVFMPGQEETQEADCGGGCDTLVACGDQLMLGGCDTLVACGDQLMFGGCDTLVACGDQLMLGGCDTLVACGDQLMLGIQVSFEELGMCMYSIPNARTAIRQDTDSGTCSSALCAWLLSACIVIKAVKGRLLKLVAGTWRCIMCEVAGLIPGEHPAAAGLMAYAAVSVRSKQLIDCSTSLDCHEEACHSKDSTLDHCLTSCHQCCQQETHLHVNPYRLSEGVDLNHHNECCGTAVPLSVNTQSTAVNSGGLACPTRCGYGLLVSRCITLRRMATMIRSILLDTCSTDRVMNHGEGMDAERGLEGKCGSPTDDRVSTQDTGHRIGSALCQGQEEMDIAQILGLSSELASEAQEVLRLMKREVHTLIAALQNMAVWSVERYQQSCPAVEQPQARVWRIRHQNMGPGFETMFQDWRALFRHHDIDHSLEERIIKPTELAACKQALKDLESAVDRVIVCITQGN
ncbi:hypothetical protein CEUSTIGMA_g10370.t1 [Chlamydomonas eustigma]|uniref:Uncharacterized protein n=1 Tax=Chlamydomonas eustigma TaxID=1157962 RepID=A0A250XIS5_9CHLO|nr:hypothetical protein CEUSTIGMA_g10370.t1 [Chlamydomonas eustigma]|eukprot:GAX82943.1 hypothetical protein CEUSTIGMA_g10370.t1 [Chlamydomonas eustigma]